MNSPAFSLQRDSTNQAVNWDAVDDELDKIPSELKDPRFDSLRHVLNILSAVDAEAALEELRGQRDTIEGLVDEVVSGYHNGFNKAIHNYSQILQLFADCKTHVNTLRSSLQEAKGQLGAQSRSLQQQWRRSISLGDIVRLLTDARSVVDVPQKLEQLQRTKDWTSAVNLLIDSCSKLARHELSRVGALEDLKKDMAHWQSVLQTRLVAEIEESLFVPQSARAGIIAEDEEVDFRKLGPTTPQGLLEASLRTDSRRSRQPAASGSAFTTNSFSSKTRPALHGKQPHAFHSDSALSMSQLHNGSQAAKITPVAGLVDCLVKIGGISEAQAALHQHLPNQMMKVILNALQTASTGAQQPSSAAQTSGTGKVSPAIATTVHITIERVFDHCQQVLRGLIQAFKLLADAPAAPVSAGMDLLNAHRQVSSQQASAAAPGNPTAYVRKETQYAWECIQKECQKVLAMLLQGQTGAAAVSTQSDKLGGWLSKDSGRKPEEAQQLSFSFAAQVQDKGGPAATQSPWHILASTGHLADEAGMLRQALAGLDRQGGLYLTPVLYRPTVQFVDGSARLLNTAERDNIGGWFSKEDTKPGAARSLRMFMESFVTEKFLPEIYLDFRGQCTHMLEDADAMKAHAQLHGTYNESAAKGRPLLHAALQAERLIMQLIGWAAHMPLFAAHITGVVENILGRVLEAFQARMGSLLGYALSKGFAENPAMALQMAAEPAAVLAGEPVAFFVGKATETTESFVKAVMQSGLGSGDESTETIVLMQLAQVKPVREDQLVSASGDMHRLVNLATLSDSLDYLADAIQHFGDSQQPRQSAVASKSGGAAGQAGLYTGRREHKANQTSAVCLTEGLTHLMNRYRALAGQCIRSLRIEMHLLVMYHMQDLPLSNYACEEDESKDVDDCVGALSRVLARADESIAPHLPVNKRNYIFGGVAAAAAQFAIWLLPDIQEWSQHGVARMCRMLTVLQPTLASLGGPAQGDVTKHFDKTRLYFSLLMYSPEGLQKAASDKPGRFSVAEYTALLQANVLGRTVTAEQKAAVLRVVGNATKRSIPLGPSLLAFRRGTNS
ncbi:TPA: hypothetical protein ACH3X1_006340 [Trebouxia sp. C0004]